VLKISKVLNSQAISLPRPNYPPMAKQIRVQGTVAVQVLIDENGKVVSAKALSGHPLLVAEAVRAAQQARFSPTMIGDQAVKVSGVITYNFIMP
jgi:protein TonB